MPMKSDNGLYELKGRDLEVYGFSRVRDIAYDAVQELWRRRKAEGWTQIDLAEKLERDAGWVSKKLRGPGNWTLKTFGMFVAGLNGDAQISVRALEDPHAARSNYHAYIDYESPTATSPSPPVETTTPTISSPKGRTSKATILIP